MGWVVLYLFGVVISAGVGATLFYVNKDWDEPSAKLGARLFVGCAVWPLMLLWGLAVTVQKMADYMEWSERK